MSVYSGFATRQQQKRYNDYIQSIITILSKRLIKFYAKQQCDEHKFKHLVWQMHDKMYTMQQSKYMEPHYSILVREMLEQLQKIYSSFQQHKEGEQFNHTFLDLKKSTPNNIKINSIPQIDSEFEETYQKILENKQSQKTLQESKNKYKSRVKTVTPDQDVKFHFFTPQKNSYSQQQGQREIQRKIEFFKKDDKRHSTLEVIRAPKIDKPVKVNSNNGQLSPRQFLRQTIMGKQSMSTLLALRTKKKHQKIIKY